MTRRKVVTLVVVLILAAAVALAWPSSGGERVYTLAQVRAGLTRRPAAWIGRVLLVRARAIIPITRSAPLCCSATLVDPDQPGQRIQLGWRSLSPMLRLALHVPLLQTFVAGRIGGVGVYRVQLARVTTLVPASGLPQYFPYTGKTVAASAIRAELVGDLN